MNKHLRLSIPALVLVLCCSMARAASNEPEVTQMGFTTDGLSLTVTYPPSITNTRWEIFSYESPDHPTNSFDGGVGRWLLAETNLVLTGATYVVWEDQGQGGRGSPVGRTNRYYAFGYTADRDADGLSDGREVLLYGSSHTNLDTDGDGSADGLEVQFGSHPGDVASYLTTVSGAIQYAGVQTGPIYVIAARTPTDVSLTNSTAMLTAPGAYVVSNVPTLKYVWLRAFRDVNGSAVYDPGEPYGTNAGNPLILSSAVAGISMEISDPDEDQDGMSDLWESSHGLDPARPDDAWQDPDLDYIPTIYEFRHGSDPRSATSTPAATVVASPGSNSLRLALAQATSRYAIVRLTPGVYTNRDTGIRLTNNPNVLIYGEAGPLNTFIDGGGTGRCFYLTDKTNAPALSGLTLRNGFGHGGGAIYSIRGAHLWVLGCTFKDNISSDDGGAVMLWGGRWVFDRCRFETNSSQAEGGGLYATGDGTVNAPGLLKLVNSSFVGNRSRSAGGGLFLGPEATGTLQNVLVHGNASTGATTSIGGGICVQTTSLFMTNSIVWSNAPTGIARFNSVKGPYGLFGNCIIQSGSTNYTNGFTTFYQTSISTNDPRFRLVDFRLTSNSPCIDAGVTVALATLDVDGEVRPSGSAADIGPDEFADADGDGLPDIYELPLGDLDPAADLDGDGLTAGEEYRRNTSAAVSDTDGDGFTDGDESLMYGTDPLNVDSVPFSSLFGSIFYTGRQTGSVIVLAAAASNEWVSLYTTNQVQAGEFRLSGLPGFTSYWVRAFLDENGNATLDPQEARGDYGANEVVPTNYNIHNVYVVLKDVDADADNMPDWWELREGLNPASAMDAAFDPDVDGTPNVFEYRHASSPYVGSGTNRPAAQVFASVGGLSLGRALRSVGDYDIIDVAPGTYTGPDSVNLDFRGRTVLLRSMVGCTSVVLDAQDAARLFVITNNNARPVLSGLTLRRGRGAQGGAVFVSNASPWFIDCRFVGSVATSRGGAVWNSGGSLFFDRCFFLSNAVLAGDGGAIAQAGGTSTVMNTVFADNAAGQGGGIWLTNAVLTSLNGTHVRNAAATGGVLWASGGQVEMTSAIVWSNGSAALHGTNGAALFLASCNVQGGYPGVGMMDANPLFYGDGYHLRSGSPCRDAGASALEVQADVDRETRPAGVMDIGADEYLDVDADGMPDWWEVSYLGDVTPLPQGDEDGDLVQNIHEYELETNPGDASDFPAFALSGSVVFRGPHRGLIRIYACTNNTVATSRFTVARSTPGAYAMSQIPAYAQLWLKAYRDVNGNSTWDLGEPEGEYPGNPVVVTGTIAGLDISFDTDSDGDRMPDWWESAHGFMEGNPVDGALDPDRDGAPNVFEYWNASSPLDPASAPQACDIADGGTNTLQAAIQRVTNDYAVILVLNGTYGGAGWTNVSFGGKSILVRSSGGARRCILDGGGNGPIFRLANETGTVALAGLMLRNASATRGAAVFSTNSSPWLLSCVLASNTANLGGAGLWVHGGSPVLSGCVFDGNRVTNGNGGAVWIASGTSTFRSVASVRNTASGSGGGIWSSNSTVLIERSTLAFNIAGSAGAVRTVAGTLDVSGSVLWSNGADAVATTNGASTSFAWSDTEEPVGGTGNIQVNPGLYLDGIHLLSNSPCRDAGGPLSFALHDVDGEGRPPGAADMGADEYGDADADGLPDWWEQANGLSVTTPDAVADADGDALNALQEYSAGTNPWSADSDGDGVRDGQDGAPVSRIDVEPDGLPDDWELAWFGSLAQAGAGDPDADGWNNAAEHMYGTDPTRRNVADTNNVNQLGVQRP